jgi:hypothetical protein
MAANLNQLTFTGIEANAHALRRQTLVEVADETAEKVVRGWNFLKAVAIGAHQQLQAQRDATFFDGE